MIDPTDVTKFDRTEAELQEFWLFCLTVAGKTAVTQAKLLDAFLTCNRNSAKETPFETIKELIEDDDLLTAMKLSRLGQYTKLCKAFEQSLDLDLSTCSVSDLEAIHGAGAKTSRYFILHTRPNQRIAVLDTHVLKHMRSLGLTSLTGTPGKGKLYEEAEKAFLDLADANKMSPADYDLMIWNQYARKA